jgi:hypothetical protein
VKQNYSEETMKKILSKKMVNTPIIDNRINDTYKSLRSMGKKKTSWKTAIIGLGSIAAAFLILISIGIMNPVWASELPLIGSIFESLEEKVEFKGSYSKKFTKLEEVETDSTAEKKYVQESNGITITVSEIYAEKMALYLSVVIENEEAFPDDFNLLDNMEGYQLDTNQLMLLSDSTWDFTKTGGKKMENSTMCTPYDMEGTFKDEHTFNGIIRVDMSNFSYWPSEKEMEAAGVNEAPSGQLLDSNQWEELIKTKFPDAGTPIDIPDEFTYSLHITELFGYLLETEPATGTDDITGETFTAEVPKTKNYKGDWSFSFDVTLDTSNTQTVEVNETNEEGLGIATVSRTSEEITAKMITPEDTPEYDYILAICDADGNALETKDGNMDVYSTYGRDTSKITVYICDDYAYMDEIKGENLSSNLPGKALYKKELAFN